MEELLSIREPVSASGHAVHDSTTEGVPEEGLTAQQGANYGEEGDF